MIAEPEQRLAFIGLGNPGRKYAHTRHNMGFLVVEEFARSLEWRLRDEKQFSAKVAKGRINEKEVHLMMPLTYMNESGWAVRQYIDYYKLSVGQIVVITDDTALEFGHLRLRKQGTAGGHNGLKSLIEHLGTKEFARLRMGIGSNFEGQPLADYVLSQFNAVETAVLDEFVKRGATVLRSLTADSIAHVMNRVNTKLTL